jgi:hypothetical protein
VTLHAQLAALAATPPSPQSWGTSTLRRPPHARSGALGPAAFAAATAVGTRLRIPDALRYGLAATAEQAAAARARGALPSFDGPVPGGQQDVREDNTGVNPEVTSKRRSPVNKDMIPNGLW